MKIFNVVFHQSQTTRGQTKFNKTRMIIILNGYCHNMAASPIIQKAFDVLSETYGPQNVLIDSGTTPLEQWLKPSTIFIMIFDQASWTREQLVQLSTEGLMARLPEHLPYREVLSNKLISWMRQHQLLSPISTFHWESGFQLLEDLFRKLESLEPPAYWKPEYGNLKKEILCPLFTESYHAKDDLDSSLVRLKQSLLFPGFGKLMSNCCVCVNGPGKLVRAIYQGYPRITIDESNLASQILPFVDTLHPRDQPEPALVVDALVHFFTAMGEFHISSSKSQENGPVAFLKYENNHWPHFYYSSGMDDVKLEIRGRKNKTQFFRYSVKDGYFNSDGESCTSQDWWSSVTNGITQYCIKQRTTVIY